MKDPEKLKQLIVEQVSLVDIMEQYEVQFVYSPHHADEVQFRCPFHGMDKKPSARLYNTTQTCYCWYCKKRWDVISFISEMEKLSYRASMQHLVRRYRLDVSSIPDEPKINMTETKVSYDNVNMISLRKNIVELRQKIPLDKYKALCFVLLNTMWDFSRGLNVSESVRKIEEKVRALK